MPPELKALLGQTDTLAKKAQGAVLSATLDIRKEIVYLAGKLNVAGSADAREAVFAQVSKKLATLSNRLNKLFLANDQSAAKHGAAQASKDTGVAVKMSKAHTDAIIDTMKATGGGNLAATMTQAMDKNIVSALRDATVSAFREQAVSGMTMKELEKVLRQKWEAVADDPKNLQFVDKSGRVWDTDTYINMQTRTNAARIYNDSLVESIGKATGSDLVMVSRGGDPNCKLCFPWEGRILSITGATKGFPTYEEARAAGLFHPNCVHTLEPVDEDLDADEIRLQSKFQPPEGLKPSDMDEQRYQMDIQRKIQEQGLDATDAKTAVDRDNLTASLRQGLILENADSIVNAMTDEQVNALCPNGNPPEFIPAKDNPTHAEEWNKGKTGGKLYINAKDLTVDKLVDVADIGEGEPLEKIEAPVKFIGNTTKADEAIQKCEQVQNDIKALFNAVNEHIKAAKALRSKTQMLFVRAGVNGAYYLNQFIDVDEELKALKLNAQDDLNEVQDILAEIPNDTPETAEAQEKADNDAAYRLELLNTIAERTAERLSRLDSGDYDGDAQKIADGAQAEIDRLVAAKIEKAVENCRQMRTDISTLAAKRRDFSKKFEALVKQGAKVGPMGLAFVELNKQMAAIEGKVKITVMNTVTAFKAKDYQTVLANEATCQEMLAQYVPLNDTVDSVGGQAIQELEGSAKTTAKEAVKAAETDAKPIDTNLPAYKFPKALTAEMLEGGERVGGTTGAKLLTIDGQQYIMKRGGNTSDAHLKNEMLGNAAYRAAGIRAPDFKTYEVNGETVALTQFIPNGQTLGDYLATATPAQKKKVLGQLREGFALDALMANWDVLGTGQDNVLIDPDGNVWRIDNGSAFGFRAQGEKKGDDFWKNRTTLDDVWSMRTASINKGVFDKLTTGQVFRDAQRIDFDAVMKALPPEYQKHLEKPLAEMRSLIRETGDLDRGGHIDAHTSGVLDDMHDLRKVGFHDRLADILTDFKKQNGEKAEVNQDNIPSALRYSRGGVATTDEVWDGDKYQKKITEAVISIKHHWKANTDDTTNTNTKSKAVMALIPELEKYAAAGDKNAKELLKWAEWVEIAHDNKFDKAHDPFPEDDTYVPTVSVKKPADWNKDKAKKKVTTDISTMMRDFIDNQEGSSGFDFIKVACGKQGSCSWEGEACKMKILAYQSRGVEWDCTKVATRKTEKDGRVSPEGALYGVDSHSYISYEQCVQYYKSHPDKMEADVRAFRAMKAATQTLFRDFPMEGKDGDDYIAVRIETDDDLVNDVASNGEFGMLTTGSCESTGTFQSTYPNNGQITIRRVPLSRLNFSFVTTVDKNGTTPFASEGESETTIDLNGIPMWNGGYKDSTIGDLKPLRKRYLAAEKKWIAAGRKLANQ